MTFVVFGNLPPRVFNNGPQFVQDHFIASNRAEETILFVTANCYEIGTGLPVVVIWQANRTAVFQSIFDTHQWIIVRCGKGDPLGRPYKVCPNFESIDSMRGSECIVHRFYHLIRRNSPQCFQYQSVGRPNRSPLQCTDSLRTGVLDDPMPGNRGRQTINPSSRSTKPSSTLKVSSTACGVDMSTPAARSTLMG